MWLTIVAGLAGLAIGFAAGRNQKLPWRGQAVPDGDGGPPGDRGAVADGLGDGHALPPVTPPDVTPGDSERVAERARLVLACASLADRLRDRQPALYGVLTRDLAAVGVTVRVVDGEPYDAEGYEPVGFEPTADPAADQRVAETVRVGVVDHGTVVRVPEVIVYRHLEDGHGG